MDDAALSGVREAVRAAVRLAFCQLTAPNLLKVGWVPLDD